MNAICRRPGVDGLALLDGQLETSQPLAALDTEQVSARRLALQPALQHRLDLVLARVRARTSCSRRASRRRNTRQRSSGIQTASSSPFHSRLASVRESSLSVLARALLIPVSSGLTTITRFTCGSRIRATSQQLPVTSNATRSLGSRLSASVASPSGVLGTRPAERTRPSSQIATTQKSRCTSRPIARPTHLVNANAITHTSNTGG